MNREDRNHYKVIKKWCAGILDRDHGYSMVFVKMIPDCVHREDYAGAQAVKDVLREWYNKNRSQGDKEVTDSDLLNLPEFEQKLIHCHISYTPKWQDSDLPSTLNK